MKHNADCECPECYEKTQNKKEGLQASWIGIFILIAVIILFVGTCHAAEYTDDQAIKAIMGEAESEPYLGKIALAKTIINRGHLRGVYGYKSIVFKDGEYYKKVSLKSKYYKRTGKKERKVVDTEYESAKAAWEYAKRTHGEGDWNATGWGTLGDIQQFKRAGWFKNCEITAHIGNHYFYREVK